VGTGEAGYIRSCYKVVHRGQKKGTLGHDRNRKNYPTKRGSLFATPHRTPDMSQVLTRVPSPALPLPTTPADPSLRVQQAPREGRDVTIPAVDPTFSSGSPPVTPVAPLDPRRSFTFSFPFCPADPPDDPHVSYGSHKTRPRNRNSARQARFWNFTLDPQ